MPIAFEPMRKYMREHHISYYYMANKGIEPGTFQRIRHDKPVSTTTLGKLCKIMNCTPAELICYREAEDE